MPYISIILPCRNEEKSIGQCIVTIKNILHKNNIDGQIIISDSSFDKSAQIAQQYNVDLIKHNKKDMGRLI